MKTLNRTLSTMALAATTLSLPMMAQANNYSSNSYNNTHYNYETCKKKDEENQVVGGLIGAIAGGIIGSQVSGNGARTEGSVLGAVIGGGLGAAIGDDTRNCAQETGYVKNTTTYYPTTTYPTTTSRTYGTQTYSGTTTYPSRTYSGTTTYPSRTYTTQTYPTRTYPSQTYGSYHNRTYGTPAPSYRTTHRSYPVYNQGYSDHDLRRERRARLDRINYKIDAQRVELRRLQAKLEYRDNPRLRRRVAEAEYEFKRLKKRKKQIKRQYR